MKVICASCKEHHSYPSKEAKYLDPDLYVCSAECLLDYIKDSGWDSTCGIPSDNKYLTLHEDYLSNHSGIPDSSGEYQSEMMGISFRSRYEVRVCEFLMENKIPFEYEKYSFLMPHAQGEVYWMPDLYLPHQNLFLEVKGVFGPGFRKKLECFREFVGNKVVLVHWLMEGSFPAPINIVDDFFKE